MEANSLNNRIKVYKNYKKLLKNFTHEEQQYFVKDSVIGEGYQGKVYKYIRCKTDNCESIAIKKIYIDKKQSKFIKNYLDKKALKYGVFIELAAARLTNQLLLQNISPNFVFNYVSSFSERTGICNDHYPYSSYYYNEYIQNSETYDDWVYEKHLKNEWYNVYFQIIVNIYILQKYFNMTHLDLHAGNILVKKIPKGGYWEYIINDKSYKLPNLGYQLFIIDFGQAWIPDLFKTGYVKNPHKAYDLQKLFRSTLNFSSSSKEFKTEIRNIIKRIKNEEHFEIIINDIWGKMYDKNNNIKIIDTYNTNTTLKINTLPIILKNYLRNIKKNVIKKINKKKSPKKSPKS
jgi:hypothetical protein